MKINKSKNAKSNGTNKKTEKQVSNITIKNKSIHIRVKKKKKAGTGKWLGVPLTCRVDFAIHHITPETHPGYPPEAANSYPVQSRGFAVRCGKEGH